MDKPVCATCGHQFRSGEERSVHNYTGEQTCDHCMYGGTGTPRDADTSTLGQLKERYGIETKRKVDEDGNIIEVIDHSHDIAQIPFWSSGKKPPPEWVLIRDEKRAEKAKWDTATSADRRTMARYRRTHGLLPKD